MTEKIQAGFGKMNITPPFGCEMSGFVARQGGCQGVHDPLWARALVLTDGRTKIALVIADLIGLDRETVRTIRTQAHQQTGIPADRIIIGAIHTHSGPVTVARGFLGQADPGYLDSLVKNIAGAVFLADQALEPVRVLVGESVCQTVGKNRRHPGGPTDPAVTVLCLEGAGGRKRLLVNYACHPTVLGPENLLISADYPHYLTKTLEAIYPGAEILFVNGATGDVNAGHTAASSIRDRDGSGRTFAAAEHLGRLLAGRVIEAVETAVAPAVASGLRFQSRELVLELEPPLTESEYRSWAARFEHDAAQLRGRAASYGEIRQAELWTDWARQMERLAQEGKLQPDIRTEVSTFSLGEAEFVTLPGEFFHRLGLAIRDARPERRVFNLGYCNDAIGYVAPRPEYPEGGYEINDSYRYYGLPSKLIPGAGEKVIETLGEMLAALDPARTLK